jgi:hypothetical protein
MGWLGHENFGGREELDWGYGHGAGDSQTGTKDQGKRGQKIGERGQRMVRNGLEMGEKRKETRETE